MRDGYRVCTRCVMDTTDPDITFDDKGVCSHCRTFDADVRPQWEADLKNPEILQAKIDQIKLAGRGKRYDCIMGLSGGADSSYMALKVKEYGLRPLVVHIDGGWNSELAVHNIERLLQYCEWDLFTIVIDWAEMKDLQRAYFRSGVANLDVPQDHAFFAGLYGYAVKNDVRYVLSGGNIATEGISTKSWEFDAMDLRNLRAIHAAYGDRPLKTYPTVNFFKYYCYYPFIRRMKVLRMLNYIPYNKLSAVKELEAIGWKNYGRKHGESVFTKFFQNYYLPTRYGFDKRRTHFSSMILSGTMTRDEAVRELQLPLYDPQELLNDKQYIAKKLSFTEEEFDAILRAPLRNAGDFPSYQSWYLLMKRIQRRIEGKFHRKINNYS